VERKMKKTLYIFIIILLILINCDKFFNQEDKNDFFPISDQNSWQYIGRDPDITWRETYRINGTETHNNGYQVFIREHIYRGNPQPDEYLYQDDSGLYIYYFLDVDTPFQILKYPINVDDEWEFDYGIDTYNMEYASAGELTVPAGTFQDVYKIVAKHNKVEYLNYWYKPGIGILKYAWLDYKEVLELDEYTIN
jgi:hypothetical protein